MKDIIYKNSSAVIVKNKLGQILFLKRKSNGLWTIPGGKAEEGETSLECALRELKEETGIKNMKIVFFTHTLSNNNGINWKETTYIGEVNNDRSPKNTEEDIFSEISSLV